MKISGKIIVKETSAGIPDLQIIAFDSGISSKTSIKFTKGKSPDTVERLGSTLSEQNGWFELDLSEVNPGQKRNLSIAVLAPEDNDLQDPDLRVLYISAFPMLMGGLHEKMVIRIALAKLEASGVIFAQWGGTSTDAKTQSEKTIYEIEQQKAFKKELVGKFLPVELQKRVKTKEFIREAVYKEFFGLNDAPGKARADQKEAMDEFNKRLTKAPDGKKILFQVPNEEYEEAIRSSNPDQALTDLANKYAPDPAKMLDGSSIYRKEAQSPIESAPSSNNEEEVIDNTEEDVQSTTAEELLKNKLDQLLDNLVSPEETLQYGLNPRADQDAVYQEIVNLKLNGGGSPADNTAYFDFHALQIAFPHVWHALLDQEAIQSVEYLVNYLQDLGVDIDTTTTGSGQNAAGDTILGSLEKTMQNLAKINFDWLKSANSSSSSEQEDGSCSNNSGQTDDELGEVSSMSVLNNLLKDTGNSRKYKFDIFKPGVVNFGLVVTYRQKWEPLNYQVGDLVRSIPLAPKEIRKVNVKKVVKKDRATKEMESNLQSMQSESNETARSEREIIDKVARNSSLAVNGSSEFKAGAWFSSTVTSDFKTDASKSSDATKKEFRESVVKASQEYKNERKLEVDIKEVFESEYTESTEISNPNDELTVTYLFYELQRRYRISEHLYKIMPVVLVPLEVPGPDKKSILEMLLKYYWIVNRVLLDDSFRSALMDVATGTNGEKTALTILENTITVIKTNIEAIKNQITLNNQVLIDVEADVEAAEKDVQNTGKRKYLDQRKTVLESRQEAVEQVRQQERAMAEKLSSEVSALNQAAMQLVKAKADYENRQFQINALVLHIRENILYYMQAIWSYMYKDQWFMMLRDDKVPVFNEKKPIYDNVAPVGMNQVPTSIVPKPNHTLLSADVQYSWDMNTIGNTRPFQQLIEIADLDRPLGFKGNYMIFPMRQSNPVTDFMMTPYIDEELGLRDPDGLGNWTPDTFAEYFAYLEKTMHPGEFAAIEDQLKEQYLRIVNAPRRLTEDIVVPTESIYIEALPGKYPILEDFKLQHRAIDVKKVQAEVRKMELENLRYAARLMKGELEDPDVDKKVVVENGERIMVNLSE